MKKLKAELVALAISEIAVESAECEVIRHIKSGMFGSLVEQMPDSVDPVSKDRMLVDDIRDWRNSALSEVEQVLRTSNCEGEVYIEVKKEINVRTHSANDEKVEKELKAVEKELKAREAYEDIPLIMDDEDAVNMDINSHTRNAFRVLDVSTLNRMLKELNEGCTTGTTMVVFNIIRDELKRRNEVHNEKKLPLGEGKYDRVIMS